jgi:hypothetical protein
MSVVTIDASLIPETDNPSPDMAPTETHIRLEAERRMDVIRNGYFLGERETFDEQVREVEAYLADPQAETPFLTLRANRRGISVADLASSILSKRQEFRLATAQLYGAQDEIIANPPATVGEMRDDARWPSFS